MEVGIHEAGDCGAALKVDDSRVVTAQAGDFRIAARCHYPPVRNGYCLNDRAFRVKRMQPPIQDDGVCVAWNDGVRRRESQGAIAPRLLLR